MASTASACTRGARVAVEDEAAGAIGRIDALGDDGVDDVIGHQFACIHHGLGAFADIGAGGNRGAQHIAGGQLRDRMRLDQTLGLSPLPRARRSQKYKSHRPFLPPRSLDFLISPSYCWAIRCP